MPVIIFPPYQIVAAAESGDPNFNNVSLLVPFDGSVTDVKNHSLSNTAVTINTTVKKMGTGSGRFNGASAYVQIAAAAEFDYGTGPLTIEGWFNADNVTGTKPIFALANRAFLFQLQGSTPVFYINSVASGWAGNGGTVVAGVWNHFALVRVASGVCTLYLNGVAVGLTPTHTEAMGSSTSPMRIGSDVSGGTFFLGYIDDFRITKGVARYTSAFTPPTTAHPTS